MNVSSGRTSSPTPSTSPVSTDTVFDWLPTGQGKLEKVRKFEWSGKRQGKIFFGKVRENDKIGATRCQIFRLNALSSISAGAPPQTPLGELTALPQTP